MLEVNSDTIESFLKIKTKRDLAKTLEIEYKDLIYNLHIVPQKSKYKKFQIKKKSGGFRVIYAPVSGIKEIQKRLCKVLLKIYPPKSCVHGYIESRSIITNAKQHLRKKHIVNIDLKDFFPTINFGRVQGIFRSFPFHFNAEISTALAQICCYRKKLPQGAPTSPIVSNFICRKLDNELMSLCIKLKCTYSRYADDITISTNQKVLPKQIGRMSSDKMVLSKIIIKIIVDNDFTINTSKVSYASKMNRQIVTGIKVNEFPNVERSYIREVRAMLHAWEKFGISDAAREHFQRCLKLNLLPDNPELLFKKILVGRIGYIGNVRGKKDEIYHKLYRRIKKLFPDVKLSIIHREDQSESFPILFGEGKSDWKHIKAALTDFQSRGIFNSLEITFKEYETYDKVNCHELLKMCETLSKSSVLKNKHIFMFDRDVKNIIPNVDDKRTGYKYWGNNVYSFVIPQPAHRGFNQVCIEHYYDDSDLRSMDEAGRRIYLSDEFDKSTGEHTLENLFFQHSAKLNTPYPAIIDYGVYDSSNQSLALSKNRFATNILNKTKGFDNFEFSHFELILNILKNVIDSD